MEEKTKSYLRGLIVGAAGATVWGTFSDLIVWKIRRIPNDANVQSGFIPPSKLEITVQDADQNGEKETVVNIDNKSYLLMADENNNPILRPYTVRGPEILYQK